MHTFANLSLAFVALSALAACEPLPPVGSPEAASMDRQADESPMELPTPDTAVPRSTDAGNETPNEGISPARP
jgi:hypothetical protein